MGWNHRLVQMNHGLDMGPWVEIQETYYNEDGSIAGFCAPCFGTEYPDQMIRLLERMIDDIKRNPQVLKLQDAVGHKESKEPF